MTISSTGASSPIRAAARISRSSSMIGKCPASRGIFGSGTTVQQTAAPPRAEQVLAKDGMAVPVICHVLMCEPPVASRGGRSFRNECVFPRVRFPDFSRGGIRGRHSLPRAAGKSLAVRRCGPRHATAGRNELSLHSVSAGIETRDDDDMFVASWFAGLQRLQGSDGRPNCRRARMPQRPKSERGVGIVP